MWQSGRTGQILMSGDFDMSGHEVLHTALADSLGRHAHGTDLVVDLSDVTFLDAGSVGVLLEAWETAASLDVRLRITGASGIVRRVIQTCGAWERFAPAGDDGSIRIGEADGFRAEDDGFLAEDQVRLRDRLDVIDAEVRTTRRAILNDLRNKLRNNHSALSDDVLALSDGGVSLDAIILAATIVGGADACDLQVYDPRGGSLTIVRHHGFTEEFLTRFAVINAGDPTSCAVAAATGQPVIVDDVAHSPLFAADPAGLAVLLAAGSRAVQSHPLRDEDGRTVGVLSFHYRMTNPRRGQPELVAWWAQQALSRASST